jgi:hypothetical protein
MALIRFSATSGGRPSLACPLDRWVASVWLHLDSPTAVVSVVEARAKGTAPDFANGGHTLSTTIASAGYSQRTT